MALFKGLEPRHIRSFSFGFSTTAIPLTQSVGFLLNHTLSFLFWFRLQSSGVVNRYSYRDNVTLISKYAEYF